jgi:thiol:disulfide interchange protein DsbD
LGGADLHLRPGEGANPEPGEISFFEQASGSQRVDSQAAQKLGVEEGGWRLFLPYLPGQGAAGTLTGLLQAPAGWRQDEGQTNYLQVELSGGEALAEPPGGVALTLLFAFLGGLILNIMPCVFPVIGLKILGFARQAGQGRRAVFRQGVFYSLGVVTTFLALAILAITLGRGWGMQLQAPWFIYVLGQLFLAISLNLAGVFMVGGAVSGGLGSRAFASGLLAVLAATPCSAPFLGTALAYALTLPPLMALGLFLLMGIGFALPYLVLALFPGLLKYLPRPGPWLETFRQAMSFPLFATVGYLLWTLAGMTDEGYFLLAILGLVLAAFAWWLYGHGQLTGGARWRGRLLALLLLLLGWWLGLPGVKTGLVWEEWSPDRVAEYRHAGRPVLVDFTARWCATCQVNKLVWTDPRIAESLAERGVALLRADWTLEDPRITRALRDEFSRVAIPLVALYLPEGGSPQILPDLLTSGDVLSALALLPPREDAIF